MEKLENDFIGLKELANDKQLILILKANSSDKNTIKFF